MYTFLMRKGSPSSAHSFASFLANGPRPVPPDPHPRPPSQHPLRTSRPQRTLTCLLSPAALSFPRCPINGTPRCAHFVVWLPPHSTPLCSPAPRPARWTAPMFPVWGRHGKSYHDSRCTSGCGRIFPSLPREHPGTGSLASANLTLLQTARVFSGLVSSIVHSLRQVGDSPSYPRPHSHQRLVSSF